MILSIAFTIAGFVALVFGASWLVDGASCIAKRLGISPLTIGLTIVAFGTSAPELAVNLISAVSGSGEIALGNILGSNIFNVFAILGVAAIVKPITIQPQTLRIEIPFLILSASVVAVLGMDSINGKGMVQLFSRSDSLVLLLLFAVFIYYNFLTARSDAREREPSIQKRPMWLSLLMVIGGIALLMGGGKLIVMGAVDIALRLGVSQSVIGLTIVAAGTSLPELATSAIAAYKGKPDIAIGNVIGSNVFNSLLVLGTSSFVSPIALYPSAAFDIALNIAAGIIMLFFAASRRSIARNEGVMLVLMFIAYNAYLVLTA